MSHRPVSWRLDSLVAVIYTLSSDSTFRCSGVSQSYTKSRIRSGSPPPNTHTMCFGLQWTIKTCVQHIITSPNFAAIEILLQVISIFSKKELPILILHLEMKYVLPRSMKYVRINFERKHMFIYSIGLIPQFFN